MSQISVIIPVHNRRTQLVRALRSVIHQTRPAAQIIVVDDGSTDEPARYIASQLGEQVVIEFVHQSNLGVSSARNAGLKRARYDWIALLDSDDEWLPQKLEQQCKLIEHDKDSLICHTDEIWIRNGRRVNAKKKHTKVQGRVYHHCLPLCAISPSSVLIHQSVFNTVGEFDESLPACEDYDLWLRMTSAFNVALVDQPLLRKFGGHSDQLSARYWGMDRFRVKSLRRMLKELTWRSRLTLEEAQMTHTVLVDKLRILINGAEKRGHSSLRLEWESMLQQTLDEEPIECR